MQFVQSSIAFGSRTDIESGWITWEASLMISLQFPMLVLSKYKWRWRIVNLHSPSKKNDFVLLEKKCEHGGKPIISNNEMVPKTVSCTLILISQYSSVQSLSRVQFLQPHGTQHARLPCPSQTPGVYQNSCSSSRWCHPTISSSIVPFSSCLQSFPASGYFQMSQFFTSSGQSIGVSASTSVFPINTQDWSPLGWTGWISLQSKGLSRVFAKTTVQKHQFLGTQLSL